MALQPQFSSKQQHRHHVHVSSTRTCTRMLVTRPISGRSVVPPGGRMGGCYNTSRAPDEFPVERHARCFLALAADEDGGDVTVALACGQRLRQHDVMRVCVIIIESRTSCLMCELCVVAAMTATTTTVPSNTSIENIREGKKNMFIYSFDFSKYDNAARAPDRTLSRVFVSARVR